MRSTLLGFLLIFLPTFLIGQQIVESEIASKEFGLDATFINRFLPFDNTIGQTNDYLFFYRVNKKNGRFSRADFDVDFAFDSENERNERRIASSRLGFDFRIGGGKTIPIHKRWNIMTGFDWTAGTFYSAVKVGESSTGNNDGNRNSTIMIETGIGPFIGLQFNINDKFGIYTEADFYVNLRYETFKFETERLSQLDEKTENISFADRIGLPGSLVIFYRFN